MNPEGSIVVVTGAAGGIGGALVRALVERDARTVVAADLAASAQIPVAVCDRFVRYVTTLDDAVVATFGEEAWM